MNYDDWPDQTLERRRKRVRETIRPATWDELKQLVDVLFPIVNDPWYEGFQRFLADHQNARFFVAQLPEGAQIAYCQDTGTGIWFLPGTGMGFIQDRGLAILKQITESL